MNKLITGVMKRDKDRKWKVTIRHIRIQLQSKTGNHEHKTPNTQTDISLFPGLGDIKSD